MKARPQCQKQVSRCVGVECGGKGEKNYKESNKFVCGGGVPMHGSHACTQKYIELYSVGGSSLRYSRNTV